jgi:glycerol-1-phosphate dehydrogenase [NAD(P)+]
MELPTRILIGSGVLRKLGSFVEESGVGPQVVVAAGTNVQKRVRAAVNSALGGSVKWVDVSEPDQANVARVSKAASGSAGVVGVGGGKSVDVAKLAAFRSGLPFISVPTSASHDGIASPFASIRGLDRPYSLMAKPPVGILADVKVIASAPRRLLSSGCGDLVSKLTAVKDWQLAHKETGEYYGGYAANLATMSAEVVIEHSSRFRRYAQENVRDVVEALISAGVAAGIAGSSRPCSGAEHLFSHYLDIAAPGKGMHGEKCGLGTIMMSKLHGLKWERVQRALSDAGAPTKAKDLGLTSREVVTALVRASTIRPDRYTILSKIHLQKESAEALARATGVL